MSKDKIISEAKSLRSVKAKGDAILALASIQRNKDQLLERHNKSLAALISEETRLLDAIETEDSFAVEEAVYAVTGKRVGVGSKFEDPQF